MISFTKTPALSPGSYFRRGFYSVDTDDLDRLKRCITGYCWSPVRYKHGVRKEANFIEANWVALDFDSGELTLDAAVEERFADFTHIIGTTKSHQKDKGGYTCDRFRVLLKLERAVKDLREYRYQLKRLLDEHEEADSACKDGARFFYPCVEVVSAEVGDYELEVYEVPEDFGRPFDYSAYINTGVMPPFARYFTQTKIPVGERNTAIYRCAKDLIKCGYTVEETLSQIVNSPTYKGCDISEKLSQEIEKTIRSAVKAAEECRT